LFYKQIKLDVMIAKVYICNIQWMDKGTKARVLPATAGGRGWGHQKAFRYGLNKKIRRLKQ
jgi:hypothetical protein